LNLPDPSPLSIVLADRYRIERQLGQGGMATVYLAHDLKHDRDVAIKVLRPEIPAILGSARLLKDIRISAQLDHPHILTLIDSGETAGVLYYVLPYVRGELLRHKFEWERQLSIEEALAITRQVAGALDYAHRQGVIQRDIKPENILLHEGEAVVEDFGISMALRQAGGSGSPTKALRCRQRASGSWMRARTSTRWRRCCTRCSRGSRRTPGRRCRQ
jgi:eukaryotic-like serine/threonine-protein kinase